MDILKTIYKYVSGLLAWMSVLLTCLLAACPAHASEISATHQIQTFMKSGYAAYDKGDMAGAIRQFLEAHALSERHGNYDRLCLASYNLGTSYFQLRGYNEALDYYIEALELCEKHKLPTSRRLEILYGISGVFFEQGNFKKARDLTSKIYKIARAIPDSLMCENAAFALAMISNKFGQYHDTRRYLDIASRYGATVSKRRDILEAEALYLQKKFPELKQVVERALKGKALDGADLGLLYFYQAQAALAERDYQTVLAVKDKALSLINLEDKVILYNDLAHISENMGDLKGALAYKDSAIVFRDSLNSENNRQISANFDTRFELMNYRLDKEQEIAGLQARTRKWIMIAGGALLLGVIAWMIVAIQRQRTRHRHQIMEMQMERQREQQALAEERMKETELIAEYRQKLMAKEIESKNAELSASSMFVSSRNKLVRDLLKELGKIEGGGAMQEIRQVTNHLTRLLDDQSDEESFRVNFDAANPGFSRRLLERHPDLLPGDIRFLAYIRMNMSTKEIASMLNINPESCKRRKIRLGKKLGLEGSADLYSYILAITENADFSEQN